jgi:5-methylthioribose kinase
VSQPDPVSCDFPLLRADDVSGIAALLDRISLLAPDESIVRSERAGDGNMNLVLRVVTDRRSLIVKQSRPWVEKYPQIAAPAERIAAEIRFYECVESVPDVAASVPKLLGLDHATRLMVLEDCGDASDYSDLYASRDHRSFPVGEVTQWLGKLHAINIPRERKVEIGCHDLLLLNHAHIFEIPLQSPAVIPLDNVCAGLEGLAQSLRSDPSVVRAASRLGRYYLGSLTATKPCLLHGDFYPGSWLRTHAGLRFIDPEFCFVGPAEFDVAVLAAHQALIGGSESPESVDRVCALYRRTRPAEIDVALARGFAGMEIIRRLIGVAQLPLDIGLSQRSELLQLGRSWLCDSPHRLSSDSTIISL